MEEREVISALMEVASGAEEPEQLQASMVDEALVEAAMELYGDWLLALGAALMEATRQVETSPNKGRKKRAPAVKRGAAPVPEKVERDRRPEADGPIYVESQNGLFFEMEGADLELAPKSQQIDEGEQVGGVRRLHEIGEVDSVVLFSDAGRFFGINRRLIPRFSGRDQGRTIRDILFLEEGESIRGICARRDLARGRFIHVTRQGKSKATEGADLMAKLERSGNTAFKLRDGDVPIAVFGAREGSTIFCASALGKGIHFEADELRSMGRKAMGVNAIKLRGDDDEVVGAFEGRRVRQVAVIMESGLGKRVDFGEFRTQGRAGQGMQLARLNRGDRVATVAPCHPGQDLGIISSSGKVWRLPATHLPHMGRPAKGDPVVDLEAGEVVTSVEALPCAGSMG